MIAAVFSYEMQREKRSYSSLPAYQLISKILRYLLSSVLLSIFSARAEAPAPSQEFWNYFVEFGDAQGELFDPTDYAAVANLPDKVKQEIENTSAMKRLEQVSSEKGAAQEQSK